MKYTVEYESKTEAFNDKKELREWLDENIADEELKVNAMQWIAETDSEEARWFEWRGLTVKAYTEKPEPKPIERPARATEFIIITNTPKYGWCLKALAGTTREMAESTLKRWQEKSPSEELAIKEVYSDECWWNDPFLAN